jgi:hypothetical protein
VPGRRRQWSDSGVLRDAVRAERELAGLGAEGDDHEQHGHREHSTHR